MAQLTRALDRLHARPAHNPAHPRRRPQAPTPSPAAGPKMRGVPVKAYPPSRKLDGPGRDWKFRRNTRMLLASKPDLVVAFPGGPGTAHTVRETGKYDHQLWDLRKGPDQAPLPQAANAASVR